MSKVPLHRLDIQLTKYITFAETVIFISGIVQ